jgi:PPK2 family polyphosphate:nucleotide phosphotransferase
MVKVSDYIFLPGGKQRLSDFPTIGFDGNDVKKQAKKFLASSIEELASLQDMLYAHDRFALLIIFQAMDAAGKDGTIKHVMSGVNPQGCRVTSFKKPSDEELSHSFLWRCYKALPAKGMISIFNRSYYEEVLIVRVHPEVLWKQKLPNLHEGEEVGEDFWQHRYEAINHFEDYLENNGVALIKFFLNVSNEEQRRRFLKRIENPSKHWKISLSDFKERKYWDDYMNAYEQMLINTSTEIAPWHVIPADDKWFMRAMVSKVIVEKLKSLKLHYPEVGLEKLSEIEEAKKWLEKYADKK